MNIKTLGRVGIISGEILLSIFILFLLLPFILNFFIYKYTPQIVGEINKATGLSAGIEELKIVTTPKLTAGIKVKNFELYTPQKEPVIIADNFQIKMSLIPILTKNIRIDAVSLDNADITLQFNKDGSLYIEKYFPPQTESKEEAGTPSYLPLGLKLSNHLPDIHIGSYKLSVIDGADKYVLKGNKTDISDFILNKSIKVKGCGSLTLKDKEQFKYNVKLFNKIMPDVDLNELVFNPQNEDKKDGINVDINIIEILKGLYNYKFFADTDIDLKTSPENIEGIINIKNVSLIDLPKSNAELKFKGKTIDLAANIYTAKNEVSKLSGKVATGKQPYLDLNFKSDLEISNVLNITKKVAEIFNINDLKTLSANGKLSADFDIKSDTKTVKSSGYLKIPFAKLFYGVYNIGVDNINADISLNDNNINVKNVSFSILGQPLKLFGTINQDAVSDLHLTANKLSLKGLLIACGQASLLKENPVYSGDISMDVIIKGKLEKINPIVKIDIQNADIKNLPSDIRLKAPQTKANIVSDGKTFSGNAISTNVLLINPAAKVSAPKILANIKEQEIEFSPTPVTIEKIKTNVSGKITNYLTEKIGLNFISTGDIKSALSGNVDVLKQSLNLTYTTTEMSEIIIPLFDKSKMLFKGKLNITGSMVNPIVSGIVSVPKINIPEIPVTMNNMDIKLQGTILHGSATVQEFISGGIKAQNCVSDIELKGNDFYLKNLQGTAFGGKINGNIIYNLANAKTKIDFKGEGLNAEKAIEGAAGIKNALTGTLNFNTKLTLTVLDYNDMIKSMKGDLNFDIKNGAFGSIGRLEGLLSANNILTNTLLKNTVASITNATGLATTAQFDTLSSSMTFSDGWANLKNIKSAGKSLCYYVTGKFNLINSSANVVILGRLDAPMVAKLGILGQLSADKILGSSVAKIVKVFTTDPRGENIAAIPALTNGSTNYKDFKVNFNGGIESKSSVKIFKWLSNPDMSEVDGMSTKDAIKTIKTSVNQDIKSTVNSVTDSINTQKQQIKDTTEQFKNSAEEIKNLWKSVKQQAKQSSQAESAKEILPGQNEAASQASSKNSVQTSTEQTTSTAE